MVLFHVRLHLERSCLEDVLALGGGETAVGQQARSSDNHDNSYDAFSVHAANLHAILAGIQTEITANNVGSRQLSFLMPFGAGRMAHPMLSYLP